MKPVLLAIAVTTVGVTSQAAAQPRPSGDPGGTTLTVSASTFGGYDTDVTGTAVNADTRPSAMSAGAILTLNYRVRSEKIAFATRASTDSRYYDTDTPIQATSYSGLMVLGAEVTPRLRVDGSLSGSYAPQFAFSVLPVDDVPEDLPPPTLDYGITPFEMTSFYGGTTARLSLSRRSSLYARYDAGQYRFPGQDYQTSSHGFSGGYSQTLSRHASVQLGYTQQESEHPSFAGSAAHVVRQRSLNAGINYSRPLSASRRTTLSFGSGSSAIENYGETFYTATGNASLGHLMGRTWNLTAAYSRGLSVVAGFTEPFFADTVTARIRGNLSRAARMIAWAGFADGNVGLGSRAEDYRSFQASARLEVALSKRIGVFGNYFYYGYHIAPSARLSGVPGVMERQGVRGGLIVRFPIVQERASRAAR